MTDNRSRKDASVGEFDAASGLTHITQQRGRLLFNMGPMSTRRTPVVVEQPDAAAPSSAEQEVARRRPQQRVYRSGAHTGRSLFAEEVVYLMQRSALILYEGEEVEVDGEGSQQTLEDTREPLTLAQFLSLALNLQLVSMATVDAYAFLKDNKLHPRRCTSMASSDDRQSSSKSPFAFDVFKSVTQTVYIPLVSNAEGSKEEISKEVEESGSVLPSASDQVIEVNTTQRVETMKKRKLKRLTMIFRVLVYSFHERIPQPKELRYLIDQATPVLADSKLVPVKVAVVNDDRSVLLFEVA